jgi:hypothetical protein
MRNLTGNEKSGLDPTENRVGCIRGYFLRFFSVYASRDLLANSYNKCRLAGHGMSIHEILEELPKLNAQELEEVSYRVQFLRALREGLQEITDGPLIPHEQVKKELARWLSE